MEKNAAYRANIPTSFYIHLNYDAQKYKHPDLSRSRIKKDLDAVNSILGILETTFIDPLSPLPLICISASVVKNKKLPKDMLLAETLGEAAMKIFLDIRLREQRTSFFNPIKKIQHEENETM